MSPPPPPSVEPADEQTGPPEQPGRAEPGAGSLEGLRATNRASLLALLEAETALSRAELMRRTGLSRSTVSSLVSELLDEGVVQEREGRGQALGGQRGRPPVLLELAEPSGVVVGVDVGHRHIRVAVAGLDGVFLGEDEVGLEVDDAATAALDRVAAMVDALLAAAGVGRGDVRAAGMGIPGPVDRDGRMTSSILPRWRGTRPAQELSDRIGVLPQVDNDAHMGAVGELRQGAARGRRFTIYLKVSTGLGAGIIVDGQLVRGATGIAGEIGHVQVDEAGVVCRCGSRGCLETEVSAPQLVTLLQPAYDEPLDVERMLGLARQGDAGVLRVLADAGRRIGRTLADLCNALNPELIVVGGALGGSPALLSGIRDSVDRHAQPNASTVVEVVGGRLGDRAEITGAVAVALERARAR